MAYSQSIPAPVLIPNVVTTVAGNAQSPGTAAFTGDGGPAIAATLNFPGNVVADPEGNLYIADTTNNVVREVNANTGVITTVLGVAPTVGCTGSACAVTGYSGDGGPATSAVLTLNTSTGGGDGLAVDALGNLYVIDTPGGSGTLRVVYKAGAQLAATITALDPTGVATSGGVVRAGYVYSIVNPTGAGHGTPPSPNAPQLPSAARFYGLTGVALDKVGNIYLADGDYNIRVINTQSTSQTFFGVTIPAGEIEVVVGNPTGLPHAATSALNNSASGTTILNQPRGLYVDPSGDLYYVGNAAGNGIGLVYAGGAAVGQLIQTLNPTLTPTVNQQYVLAGYAGIAGTTASSSLNIPANTYGGFSSTSGIAVDSAGNMYLTDFGVPAVYRIDAVTGSITEITGGKTLFSTATASNPVYCSGTSGPQTTDPVGDGCTQGQVVAYPVGVALDGAGNLYIADRTDNTVRKASIGTQFAAVAVGGATAVQQVLRIKFYPSNLPAAANAFKISGNSSDFSIVGNPSCGSALTDGTEDCLITLGFLPTGVGVRTGQLLATDVHGGVHAFGLTGKGSAPAVAFDTASGTALTSAAKTPAAVATDSQGNVYVADQSGNQVIEIASGGGTQTTLITATSVIAGSTLSGPGGIAVDVSGAVYVSDTGNSRILKLPAGGTPTVLTATVSAPAGLAVDSLGNLYIADTGGQRVVVLPSSQAYVALSQGTVSTSGVALSKPVGVALDPNGNLYIADAGLREIVEVPFSDLAGTESGKGAASSAYGTGFSAVSGVAVDAAGTMYVTDSSSNKIIAISAGGVNQTALPLTGLAAPAGIALDLSGNFYIANAGGGNIIKTNRSQASLAFASQLAGAPVSAGQIVRVSDTGTQTLAASGLTVAGTGFSQLTTGSTDCGTTTQLTPGAYCQISVGFGPPPGTTGTQTGSATLTDNALNAAAATQVIALTGVATCTCQAQTITFSLASPVVYGAAPITLNATSSSGLPVAYTVTGPATLSANVLTVTGTGIIVVVASQVGNSTYAPATNLTQSIVVNPALLTVTATSYTRGSNVPNPSPLGYALTGFVNGDTASVVTGAPALNTAATTSSPAGTYAITITIGSLAAANYTFNPVAGSLTIAGAGQTITFNALGSVTYGSAPVSLSASATSGLPVSLSVVSGPATLSNSTLTITGAGTVVVQATQPGNYANGSGYGPALPVQQPLIVNRAPLAVTAQNVTRPYGIANPTLTGTISGVLNNDNVTATYTSTATITSPPGTYPIQAVLGGANASNYQPLTSSGTLTVVIAPTTTTLVSSNPQFTGTAIILTATVTLATGGTPVSAGTVTFTVDGVVGSPVAVSAGVAKFSVGSLSAIQNVISAQYSGDNLDYSPSLSNIVIVTKPYTTLITLSASPAISNLNQAVVFTATVAAAPAPTNPTPPAVTLKPTGTVTFTNTALSGQVTVLATLPLPVSGIATLSTTALPVSGDSIVATYSGDINFLPSTSAPSFVTVTPPSFTIQMEQYGVFVVPRGGSVSSLVDVVPVGGFNQTVSFACSGLPAGATCSFSPATVTPNGSNSYARTTVTVAVSNSARNEVPGGKSTGIFAAVMLGIFGLLRRRSKALRSSKALRLTMATMFAILTFGLFAISGCATGSSNPSGQITSYVTVNATSNDVSETTSFVLTIQ